MRNLIKRDSHTRRTHSPVSGPQHSFVLDGVTIGEEKGYENEAWDTIPPTSSTPDINNKPPRSARTPLRDHDGDEDMQESTESDGNESDPGDFNDHVRSGEGYNRRMKKISLAWWRVNKNQQESDVDNEPKLDIHNDPLVTFLRTEFRDDEEKTWKEKKDYPIVCGMVDVLKSCNCRNHVTKDLVKELHRISKDAELERLKTEVI